LEDEKQIIGVVWGYSGFPSSVLLDVVAESASGHKGFHLDHDATVVIAVRQAIIN